jgi:uncharacterized protein YndB with AHSA1/START domain
MMMGRSKRDGTVVERVSDRELVVTRSFDAPARLVFAAWTTPALFMRWWAPKSSGLTILSCEMDVRTGGGYRLEFGHPASDQPMVFHGRYIEVVPDARLVWTNEEGPDGAVTTLTLEERNGVTHLTFRETYPTAEALNEAQQGMDCMPEQFGQLETLLASQGA